MFGEAHNLDSLRALVRGLQAENRRLKRLLESKEIAFSEENVFEEKIEASQEYDPDQGGRILDKFITSELANKFCSMFWGRLDVYAKRGRNGGYFPQCLNRWNERLCPKQQGQKCSCEDCKNRAWAKLTPQKIVEHLIGRKEDGSDVIGIYPLLEDGTCRFMVFDFDNHAKGSEKNDFANDGDAWHREVDALRLICTQNGIFPLVERSRSGRGAHLWIFFKRPIAASLARNFGFLLLDKGLATINMSSFEYYDRMFPCQDFSSGIGNLIALPLQGQALKNGNSAFVDEAWNAYPDQWDVLLNKTSKLSPEDVENLMARWKTELADTHFQSGERPKPWNKKQAFAKADVIGKLHITLGNGIYVDSLNLMPRLQNQVRSLAAFDNPVFYKNKRLGYSNYYNFSTVYMGRDEDGYICVPRGVREQLEALCEEAKIDFDVADERSRGKPIRVSFNGELREEQRIAASKLLDYDNGVLSATTAFGKTVVCSYLISQKKVSTLILLQSKDLQEQWMEELQKFLTIDEEPPTYKTKTGKVKKRKGVVGCLSGTKDSLTGIIDVAMVASLANRKDLDKILDSYGMVIMDECHHCGSTTAVELMQKVKSRFVYGVSATPQRSDNLERIVFMLIGPVRHSYTAKERAVIQGIGHYVYPRFSRTVDVAKGDINSAYKLIGENKARNKMIVEDVRHAVAMGRSPVILTRFREQAKYLYDNLLEIADEVFILYGENSDKENADIRTKLKNVPRERSVILVATGQKVGEGFDFPRLDTLMLAAPVSFGGRLEQYVGRLNRNFEGKENVVVYDYVDSHIGFFSNMYAKRLKTYKKLGYSILSGGLAAIAKEHESLPKTEQEISAIYDSKNYADVFERDIVDAEKRIVISSPELELTKVERLVKLTQSRIESGVNVVVITTAAEKSTTISGEQFAVMHGLMHTAGIGVIEKEEVEECFAVFDEDLVWHGGANLLGKEDVWDNLMRVRNVDVAEELLEIAFGNPK